MNSLRHGLYSSSLHARARHLRSTASTVVHLTCTPPLRTFPQFIEAKLAREATTFGPSGLNMHHVSRATWGRGVGG